MNEKILYRDPNIKSRAALVQLQWDLYILTPYYNFNGFERWLKFRIEVLTKWEKERGILSCAYCNKSPLIIHTNNRNPFCCTLDHVLARSKGGSTYNIKNIVACCPSCNAKKSNKSLDEFLKS